MDKRLATRRTMERIAEIASQDVRLLMNSPEYVRSNAFLDVVESLVHVVDQATRCAQENTPDDKVPPSA